MRSLAVFGSVARSTQRPDSDIDVLLVVDDLPSGRRARMDGFERVDSLLEPLLAQARTQGVHTIVSPVLRTPAEFEAGSLLYLDMVEQARILVDEDGVLRRFLDALGARLAAGGPSAYPRVVATTGCWRRVSGGVIASSYDGRRTGAKLLQPLGQALEVLM